MLHCASRPCTGNGEDRLDVVDTISIMASRASGILHLLSLQFEHADSSRLNIEHLASAIDSAICEIKDLRATKQTG